MDIKIINFKYYRKVRNPFRFSFLLFLTVILLTASGPQRELPKGPLGQRITEVLNVLNSGDLAKLRSYISDNFEEKFRDVVPMKAHLNIFGQQYNLSRGYDFYSILESSEYEARVVVRAKLTGIWQRLAVKIEPKPPYRIAGVGFGYADPPSEMLLPKKLSDEEIVEQLEAFLDKLVEADIFSGAVLFARNGKPLFAKAYGMASKSYDVPNRIDTKLNLGSMNKMFTSIAVVQLVEQGKLSFDDNIGKYLGSDWIQPDVGEKVKIKHLLSHTSGLGSYFNKKFFEASRDRFRNLDDYKWLVSDDKCSFKPGTRWDYSNTGFLLLGAIIEKVTGQSYFDCVREHIYQPAGMVNTDAYEMDRPIPNLAIGYIKEFTEEGSYWRNNLFEHVIKGASAGGGFSTVEDLLKFDIALRSDKLVSPETRKLIMSPKPELNSPDYGFGFQILPAGKHGSVVGHGGGAPGISSILMMFLDSGHTVVIMSNYSQGRDAILSKLAELMKTKEDCSKS